MANYLPITCEPALDRGSRMLISSALAVTDVIIDQPEAFNTIFLNQEGDRNPYSVLFSRPEDAENLINFVNQNWQIAFDWNISVVYRFMEDNSPHAIIIPMFSQRGLIADCHQILQFIADLVNFVDEPVQNMTHHLQNVILQQVNQHMQLFRNTQELQVVGYTVSSLLTDRQHHGEEEDIMMDDSDDDSSDDDTDDDSVDSDSVFSSGSDSGPHHENGMMEWDEDWSMPSSLSTDSGYGSWE